MSRRQFRRTLVYIFVVAYAAWALYSVLHAPRDERAGRALFTSIFLFYMILLTFFNADVEVRETGVLVERIWTELISFSDLRACRRVFLVPFKIAVLITKRRFPMNFLVIFAPSDDLVRALKSKVPPPAVH